MPKYFQACSLSNNSPLFKHFIMHESWQKVAGNYPNATIIFLVILDTSVDVLEILLLLSQITFYFTGCIQLYTQNYIVTNH